MSDYGDNNVEMDGGNDYEDYAQEPDVSLTLLIDRESLQKRVVLIVPQIRQVDEMAQGADDGAGAGDDEMGEVAGVNGTTGGVSREGKQGQP